MAETHKQGSVTTSDGVRLQYLEAGSGQPLVLIPGWSQTAEQFRYQLDGLSERYRVIALDMRGHGQSDKPDHGYRIARLAKDVFDVLEALELSEVALLGHSMGCSVIWSYWDLFGAHRLDKMVLCDQSPFLTANPAWSEQDKRAAGAIFTPDSATERCNALAGPEGVADTRGLIEGMVTGAMSPETLGWMIACNLLLPRAHAAALLYNHCHQDWRDIIPRIELPTLAIGGRASLIPWTCVEWTAQQIHGARLEIFEEDEGGAHFMFIENPEKFNRLLVDFLN